mmetsp:Transcript_49945/g.151998  ORF Transcript_49945/g.151998 Transcript_49945/m.151998 type:complete len:203 (+) Transcript_49945:733-1341(+)
MTSTCLFSLAQSIRGVLGPVKHDSALPALWKHRTRNFGLSNGYPRTLCFITYFSSAPSSFFALAMASIFFFNSASTSTDPASAAGSPPPADPPPADSAGTASRLTRSSLPVILVLTQPSPGPSPLTSLNFKRSPLSSSSSTKAPWLSREAAASDFRSCPCRTRMPPLSAPPTTSQICGMASPRGERAAGRAARRVAGGRVGR